MTIEVREKLSRHRPDTLVRHQDFLVLRHAAITVLRLHSRLGRGSLLMGNTNEPPVVTGGAGQPEIVSE